jgi:class 3 adenylate cyclase
MGTDEVGTLAALKAHSRELIDPEIAAHHGRMVKTTGDGALVEFASVVDAVGCAVAIQRGMVNRNANVAEDNRIVFRAGPYRRAISAGVAICDGSVRSFAAGSAPVPPLAARSDAVAGST